MTSQRAGYAALVCTTDDTIAAHELLYVDRHMYIRRVLYRTWTLQLRCCVRPDLRVLCSVHFIVIRMAINACSVVA